jgi:ABC-type glycerol-3-phosphate transport system substrate-binding protein
MKQLTRRQFLAAAGGTGAALWLGACGGNGSGSGDPMKGTLDFVTWGGPAEIKAFEAIISDFEDQNPGAKIRLQETPFNEVRQTVDSSLEAEQGPDHFRVTYTDFGFYAASNVLIDLSEYLPPDFPDAFTEGLRAAVEFEGAPYGVPHHTDVSALIYNKDLFRSAGIGALPDRLEDAWSWDEFLDVARRLRDAQTLCTVRIQPDTLSYENNFLDLDPRRRDHTIGAALHLAKGLNERGSKTARLVFSQSACRLSPPTPEEVGLLCDGDVATTALRRVRPF